MLTRSSSILPLTLLICALIACGLSAPPNDANHELLTRLGMSRRRMPLNHHKKRVASESRHHGVSSDDSHMFVIKLPPNPYYYSHLKPTKVSSSYNSVNKVPISFRANGKPARVYHWNIPVLKKLANGSRHQSAGSKMQAQDSKVYTIHKSDPWTRSEGKEVQERSKPSDPWTRSEGKEVQERSKPMKQHRKSNDVQKPSVSYYAPANQRRTMIQKYFSGNGKPHSFYVIEKSKKPTYYQRLLTLNN